MTADTLTKEEEHVSLGAGWESGCPWLSTVHTPHCRGGLSPNSLQTSEKTEAQW